MAVTSTMMPLGTPAPDFSLRDPNGVTAARDDFADAPVLLVMFLSNHCPYVQHVREELARLVAEYQGRGVAAVGICSNDAETYPQDSPERMAEDAEKFNFTFPYLVDETQEVAKAYRAACTPDFYVFDRDRALVYRGRMDETRPDRGTPTGDELRAVLDAVLDGREVPDEQYPSVGCSIKWRPGNEPDYWG
jgi:peroxiredoxin